jgi:G protein-coupled receptor Mth (Methuselah protein)
MGLNWTIGYVAGTVNIDGLWYVFVVMNSLQGVFIFVSFGFSGRVRGMLKAKFQHHLKKMKDERSYLE